MRLAVFGANGPTGRLLTGQALAAGHRVTAVTRQPHALPPPRRCRGGRRLPERRRRDVPGG
ncbi:hypothetical protein D7294_22055 [Streptomyces hoynatensis]|uniref:NAD(P)-binding domain-containing protein n=1 Tax=Streptomyces hoynatensis TaxID=1141874 RepID=A0A3A9YVM2_9ACTN|nr:hypothetical protein D7294_22055 [Streptomyces hoynatensis]